MSVLGFNITNNPDKKEDLFANLYFLFINSNTDEPTIVKHSFLLNDPDNDMAYFNHPFHNSWNMERFDENTQSIVTKLFENFGHTNSFYTDAKPISMNDKEVIITIASVNLSDKAVVKKCHISFGDFYKMTVIINDIIFKRRLSITIDKDISYNNYKIKYITNIIYLGADLVSKNENTTSYFAFYSLQDSDANKVGLAVPVLTEKNNIMLKTNKVKMSTFDSMYKDHFACDLSKILMWPTVTENGIEYKIAINRLLPAGRRALMITQDDVENSPILNPIKYIFSE